MKLSRTAGYGISALLQLARVETGQPVSCTRLAEQRKLPERFLLQVMRRLVTHGILRSTRGIEGGYTFQTRPEDVTLLQIIEAIDGPVESDIPPEIGLSEDVLVKLRGVLEQATADLRNRLSAVKLAQLAGTSSARKKR